MFSPVRTAALVLVAATTAQASADEFTQLSLGTTCTSPKNAHLSPSPYNQSQWMECDGYAYCLPVEYDVNDVAAGCTHAPWSSVITVWDYSAGSLITDNSFSPTAYLDSTTAVYCTVIRDRGHGSMACKAIGTDTSNSSNWITYKQNEQTDRLRLKDNFVGAMGPRHALACATGYDRAPSIVTCVLLKVSDDKATLEIVDEMEVFRGVSNGWYDYNNGLSGAAVGDGDILLCLNSPRDSELQLLRRVGDTITLVTTHDFIPGSYFEQTPLDQLTDPGQVGGYAHTKEIARLSATTAIACGGNSRNGCAKITVDGDTVTSTPLTSYVTGDDVGSISRLAMVSAGESAGFLCYYTSKQVIDTRKFYCALMEWDENDVATVTKYVAPIRNIDPDKQFNLYRIGDTLLLQIDTKQYPLTVDGWVPGTASPTASPTTAAYHLAASLEASGWEVGMVGQNFYKCHEEFGCYKNVPSARSMFQPAEHPGALADLPEGPLDDGSTCTVVPTGTEVSSGGISYFHPFECNLGCQKSD